MNNPCSAISLGNSMGLPGLCSGWFFKIYVDDKNFMPIYKRRNVDGLISLFDWVYWIHRFHNSIHHQVIIDLMF